MTAILATIATVVITLAALAVALKPDRPLTLPWDAKTIGEVFSNTLSEYSFDYWYFFSEDTDVPKRIEARIYVSAAYDTALLLLNSVICAYRGHRWEAVEGSIDRDGAEDIWCRRCHAERHFRF